MRGDEERVILAFCAWLEREGWTVQREVAFLDVLAERKGEKLFAEAKGRTSSPGLDVDTMYGQLLRRMYGADDTVRYAVVVPEGVVTAALRTPAWVRERLRIDVYGVDEDGMVRLVGDSATTASPAQAMVRSSCTPTLLSSSRPPGSRQ